MGCLERRSKWVGRTLKGFGMKTVLNMRLVVDGVTKATMKREIESSMIPFPGLVIEHEHESEVKNVLYNIKGDYYYVTLDPHRLEGEGEVESTRELYKELGWTILGNTPITA
jgi:hypothetical protein